jgi:hypothetical protein
MTKETLEKLLNQACELLIVFEDSNSSTEEDKLKIKAIFDEIKYSDKLDEEMNLLADNQVQDFDEFGKNKI